MQVVATTGAASAVYDCLVGVCCVYYSTALSASAARAAVQSDGDSQLTAHQVQRRRSHSTTVGQQWM